MTKITPTSGPKEVNAKHQKPKQTIAEKIHRFIKVFFYTFFALTFMLFQAPFFWTGFLVGVVVKDNMKNMIQRIIHLWHQKPYMTTGFIIASTMFAPIFVICATSFFYGGDLAVKFVEYQPKKKAATA